VNVPDVDVRYVCNPLYFNFFFLQDLSSHIERLKYYY
jgi:hypothetical protein